MAPLSAHLLVGLLRHDDHLLDDRQGLVATPPLPQERPHQAHRTTVGKLSLEMGITKTAYFTYVLVLPILFSGAHWLQIVAGWCVMQMVGVPARVIFQPAHVLKTTITPRGERGQAGRRPSDPPIAHHVQLWHRSKCSPSCAVASTTKLSTTSSPDQPRALAEHCADREADCRRVWHSLPRIHHLHASVGPAHQDVA